MHEADGKKRVLVAADGGGGKLEVRMMIRAARCGRTPGWRRDLRREAVKVTKILVALEGSREAEAALPKAVEVVKRNEGAKVVLVRAVDPATLAGADAVHVRLMAINAASEYLGEVAAELRTQGVRPVVRSVWYAAAGVTIAGVARVVKPDLIVMSARRRNDAGRLVPGPIAEFVRDRTRMPILLVAAGGMPAALPAQRTMAQEPETVDA